MLTLLHKTQEGRHRTSKQKKYTVNQHFSPIYLTITNTVSVDLNKHNYNSQYNKFSILKCQLLSQNNKDRSQQFTFAVQELLLCMSYIKIKTHNSEITSILYKNVTDLSTYRYWRFIAVTQFVSLTVNCSQA